MYPLPPLPQNPGSPDMWRILNGREPTFNNTPSSFWMEGPEGGYMVTPGVDYYEVYNSTPSTSWNYGIVGENSKVSASHSSYGSNITIGPLTYLWNGEFITNGFSFTVDGSLYHLYFADNKPADLSGDYFYANLLVALFSAKRGQSLEEIVDLSTINDKFSRDRYNPWSERSYTYKNHYFKIGISPKSSKTAFRGLLLSMSNHKSIPTFKGMNLSEIPELMPAPMLPGYHEWEIYPYNLQAQFIVYNLAETDNSLLNLINFRFRSYELIMKFFNYYAK